jgi:hypothetical protein
MPDITFPVDDGLGPDPIDRGSGKVMGAGGGGSYMDPSYEDALRIMGRGDRIPSPFEQRALVMDDAEAAELGRRLTALRASAGIGPGLAPGPAVLGPSAGGPAVGQAVDDFIAALQALPPDPAALAGLRQEIEKGSGDIRAALGKVCEQPAVQARLAGKTPPGPDFPGS